MHEIWIKQAQRFCSGVEMYTEYNDGPFLGFWYLWLGTVDRSKWFSSHHRTKWPFYSNRGPRYGKTHIRIYIVSKSFVSNSPDYLPKSWKKEKRYRSAEKLQGWGRLFCWQLRVARLTDTTREINNYFFGTKGIEKSPFTLGAPSFLAMRKFCFGFPELRARSYGIGM